MIDGDLEGDLQLRSPGAWELYRKTAETRELDVSATARGESWRREEGWAARWWDGGLRFASASDPGRLASAIALAARLPAPEEAPPPFPKREVRREAPAAAVDPPPELFAPLAQLVSE